jgi:hypothetical protein
MAPENFQERPAEKLDLTCDEQNYSIVSATLTKRPVNDHATFSGMRFRKTGLLGTGSSIPHISARYIHWHGEIQDEDSPEDEIQW